MSLYKTHLMNSSFAGFENDVVDEYILTWKVSSHKSSGKKTGYKTKLKMCLLKC